MKVLVLGADGFIGRHIAFHLRDHGVKVLAHARNPARLAAMGFATLAADLTDPATHDPAFWSPHLADHHVINAAGLLTGSEAAFRAVHLAVPQALMAARPASCRILHISAVGIDSSDTRFAHWRRATEGAFCGQIILRPGLVLADTSYGGSSLLRALAALPFVAPVVGDGRQTFNPIHAADLAQVALEALKADLSGTWEIGGPQTLDQITLVGTLRGWMGMPAARILALPYGLARALGQLGDVLQLGPISATAVAQLQAGVTADPAPLLSRITFRPRAASAFITARPSGTQDLWQARLFLLKPLIRLTLAAMWLASAALGLFTPVAAFLPALGPLPEPFALVMARLGGIADLALGLALLTNWRPKATALAQLALVAAYTAGLSLIAPALWLDPFGGLLKNLPVLALILAHLALLDER